MPEGDSLHRAAQKLRPALISRRVERLDLPRRVESTDGLLHRLVEGVEARGKNLLLHFEGGLSLHVHLKMKGRIQLVRLAEAPFRDRPGTVARLETDAHALLVERAPVCRLIRRRDLARDFHFRHLGPDLLGESLDVDEALRRLRLRNERPLGVVLMDQGAVAGIGNVWKSELCFNRGLDPFAPVSSYDDDALSALLGLAHVQLHENVQAPRRTLPDPFSPPAFKRRTRITQRRGEGPLSVYERAGKPCYDCAAPIEMRRQGEDHRSTYYCPRCQPSRTAG